MRDVEDEVREIKKEIVESRGLIIKTNNLVNALAADIKSIAKRQAGYERRFKWDSGIALAVIGAATFAGLKLYYDAQMASFRTNMTQAEAAAEEMRGDLGDEVRRTSKRSTAAVKAENYYELIRARDRVAVVEGYGDISKEALSPAEAAVFRDFERRFRTDLSIEAYKQGLTLADARKYPEAQKRYQEALELDPGAAHITSVKAALAFALRKDGKPAAGLVLAQEVAKQEADPSLQADGWWLTALCARDLGDLDTSRDALRVLINKYPRSALSVDARPLLRSVTREIYAGKDSSTAGSATSAPAN